MGDSLDNLNLSTSQQSSPTKTLLKVVHQAEAPSKSKQGAYWAFFCHSYLNSNLIDSVQQLQSLWYLDAPYGIWMLPYGTWTSNLKTPYILKDAYYDPSVSERLHETWSTFEFNKHVLKPP